MVKACGVFSRSMYLIRGQNNINLFKKRHPNVSMSATIGNFDGLHLGHQAILKNLKDIGNSILETKLISEKIKRTLNDPAPINILKGDVIVTGFNHELDDLRDILLNGKKWINNYQEKLRSELQIPKLKISHNKVFGYYIEVTKAHHEKVPEEYFRKQTLVNSERYITDDLKLYEEKVLSAESNIYDFENRMLKQCELN